MSILNLGIWKCCFGFGPVSPLVLGPRLNSFQFLNMYKKKTKRVPSVFSFSCLSSVNCIFFFPFDQTPFVLPCTRFAAEDVRPNHWPWTELKLTGNFLLPSTKKYSTFVKEWLHPLYCIYLLQELYYLVNSKNNETMFYCFLQVQKFKQFGTA